LKIFADKNLAEIAEVKLLEKLFVRGGFAGNSLGDRELVGDGGENAIEEVARAGEGELKGNALSDGSGKGAEVKALN
jgi:hypothetical protein